MILGKLGIFVAAGLAAFCDLQCIWEGDCLEYLAAERQCAGPPSPSSL